LNAVTGTGISSGSLELGATGGLTVLRGGTVTGNSLSSSGSLVLGQTGGDGTATFTVNGAASLTGSTRVIGPNVAFQADSIGIGAGHVLTPEITDASTHSPLSTVGTAELAGTVTPVFTGFTPSVGQSWELVDAAAVTGAFTPSVIPVAPGVALFIETAAGGNNGQVVRATADNQLQLSVNVLTGGMAIENLSSDVAEEIDGYRVISPGNVFNTNSWLSFQDDGQTGWEEANPAGNHIGELNLSGSRVIGAEQSISLGTPFVVPEFGVTPPEVVFEYTMPGSFTRSGHVDMGHNTLVLQVDKSSGQTAIKNDSPYDVIIDGYRILSPDGNLDPNGWASLALSDPTWEEANPASNHLGELNLTSSLAVAAGSIFSIGDAYNEAGAGTEDLVFQFTLGPTDPNRPKTTFPGVVEYGAVVVGPALEAGDANEDLEFNFDDIFQVLARGKYETGQPATWGEGDWDGAPGGSPGNPPTGSGEFDFDDIFASLVTGNYETGAYALGGDASAVPEPSSLMLAAVSLLLILGFSRRR
jgi:hypothetical protein